MSAIKGAAFEVEISNKLAHLKGCTCLSNVRVYSAFLGKMTEIDRLLITPWGLYCIEAKSFNTEISGRFEDTDWSGWSGKYETWIYNPVFQNFEHIRSLNNNLRKMRKKVVKLDNVVIVPDSCKISSDTNLVMNLSAFMDKLLLDSCNKDKINLPEVIDSLLALGKVKVR